MIIPVKCVTCGMVLASKYRYYLEKVREKRLALGMDDSKVVYLTSEFDGNLSPEGIVMNELGLKKICCRRHILSHVDIE